MLDKDGRIRENEDGTEKKEGVSIPNEYLG